MYAKLKDKQEKADFDLTTDNYAVLKDSNEERRVFSKTYLASKVLYYFNLQTLEVFLRQRGNLLLLDHAFTLLSAN